MANTELQRGFAETAEGPIHFLAAGHGHPLVLLPHGGRSSEMYRALIPILAEHSLVVALDPPGTGESVRPDSSRSIPQLADTLHLAAVATVGPHYTLYGMNGGNKLAAAIAAAHPESTYGLIFAGLTHSFVLSNSRRAQTLGAPRRSRTPRRSR